jgi:hypothetical protein
MMEKFSAIRFLISPFVKVFYICRIFPFQICQFLQDFSRDFSSYYRRTHILGVSHYIKCCQYLFIAFSGTTPSSDTRDARTSLLTEEYSDYYVQWFETSEFEIHGPIMNEVLNKLI